MASFFLYLPHPTADYKFLNPEFSFFLTNQIFLSRKTRLVKLVLINKRIYENSNYIVDLGLLDQDIFFD